ncbi:MAG: radical SAM protein [Nanoarchaeota archaeon]
MSRSIKACLINPPLVYEKGDLLGSGIPSMPVGICYLASYLISEGVDVKLIDCFGESPNTKHNLKDDYYCLGLDIDEIISRIPGDSDSVGISVHSAEQYMFVSKLIRGIKEKLELQVVVGGGFPTINPDIFIEAGADYVILGEGEQAYVDLLEGKSLKEIDGIAGKGFKNLKKNFIENLDSLPFPAVELLPLDNYWRLGYAHGPVNGKYLFLITSRGCPFNCNFCVTPTIWQRKWRGRSAKNIVDEIEERVKGLGVKDFHIQDDLFTLKKGRVIDMCKEIVSRKLDITWKIVAGTKVESIDDEMLGWMKKSGCTYISISPESGSEDVLKLMNKPYDFRKGLDIIKKCHRLGIKTQACFVLGYPGETKDDLRKSMSYMRELAKAGLDEVGLFIMCPLPGAKVFGQFNYTGTYEDMNFSPKWREGFDDANAFRNRMYAGFFTTKFLWHPLKSARSLKNLLTKRFETKTEMTVYRVLKRYMEVR